MRLVTGCLRPTPTDLLPVLGIAPPKLRREKLTDTLVHKAHADVNHPLHHMIEDSLHFGRQRLLSRHPFFRHAAALYNSNFKLLDEWKTTWERTVHTYPTNQDPCRLRIASERMGNTQQTTHRRRDSRGIKFRWKEHLMSSLIVMPWWMMRSLRIFHSSPPRRISALLLT